MSNHQSSNPTPAQDDWPAKRAVLAEVNARRVNEAIERGTAAEHRPTFLCECGHLGCTETIELTIEEYERVRSRFDRFIVYPGHEMPEVDEVLEGQDGYLLVAKREGMPAKVARASDPRSEE
jgi:hypothetical protein